MSFLIHSTSKMMNSKKLFVTDWLVFFVAIIFFIFSRYHLWFSHIPFNDISFFFFTQRSSFEHHWDKYMQVNMGFDEYEFVYPVVPEQPLDNKLVTIFFSIIFMCPRMTHARWIISTQPLNTDARPIPLSATVLLGHSLAL